MLELVHCLKIKSVNIHVKRIFTGVVYEMRHKVKAFEQMPITLMLNSMWTLKFVKIHE